MISFHSKLWRLNLESVFIGAIADHGTSSNAQETTSNMVPIDFDLVIHAWKTYHMQTERALETGSEIRVYGTNTKIK